MPVPALPVDQVGVTPRGTPARAALTHLHLSIGLTVLPLVLLRLWLWRRLPRRRGRNACRPPPMRWRATATSRSISPCSASASPARCSPGRTATSSAGSRRSLPAPFAPSYRLSVTLGYLHSTLGFWVLYLADFTLLVGLWQALRYRIAPWRLLPATDWGG
ncbi:MAG: hypothetical protein U1F11_12890 [Steroidobacteraceae bacterium]